MTTCPRCRIRLAKCTSPVGIMFVCPKCGGRATAVPVLRKAGATEEFLKQLIRRAHAEDAPRSGPCPYCNWRMVEVATYSGDHVLDLDVCPRCAVVWLDKDEPDAVPHVPKSAEKPLSEKAREQMALLQLQSQAETQDGGVGAAPPEGWQWLPFILGLPVECEAPERRCRPWATYGIILAVSAVFLLSLGVSEKTLAEQWGFIPALWYRSGGLTLLTSFFVHAGFWHVFANMYFLFVFGDNVEDNLGWPLFLLMILGAHLAGTVLHGVFDPHAGIPLIGASGGISGVLAYYAVMFPRARLTIFVRVIPLQMPAIAFLALYLFIQSIGALFQIEGGSGVSFLGHLGGLAVGLVAGFVARTRKAAPPEYA